MLQLRDDPAARRAREPSSHRQHAHRGQFYTDKLPLPRDFGLPCLWALAPEKFYLAENDGRTVNVGRLKRQWGGRLNHPDRPVLIEKSPTNTGRTRWLQRHFENACFVGIIRNGYAVAEGIRRKAGHSIEIAARQWRVSNEIMLQDFEQLEHRMLLTYEELTERPEESIQRVVEFIGLREMALDVAQPWRIHGHTAEIRNMNASSIASLTEEERLAVRREAGAMLERFGYTASLPTGAG